MATRSAALLGIRRAAAASAPSSSASTAAPAACTAAWITGIRPYRCCTAGVTTSSSSSSRTATPQQRPSHQPPFRMRLSAEPRVRACGTPLSYRRRQVLKLLPSSSSSSAAAAAAAAAAATIMGVKPNVSSAAAVSPLTSLYSTPFSSSSSCCYSCTSPAQPGSTTAAGRRGARAFSTTTATAAASAGAAAGMSSSDAATETTGGPAGGGASPAPAPSTDAIVVYVTVPNAEVGRTLAAQLVESRLAACVNILPGVTSVYWWEGKVNSDPEMLLVVKSRSPLLPELTAFIKAHHPYQEPEVLALPVLGGSPSYLAWLVGSTRGGAGELGEKGEGQN
ncbi:hypothetical protein Agub_g11521 [Astrephomene gubernaculifera]|uniref:Uncharacterized protein n=1 Tax=Astrephomene gubernaculifera TaxID=47775 RepID=A0AAD3HQQ9_9CHLO|nr:hypothetical protein Agub_g11521 [Astrephomene gubernaculifera]